MSDVPMAEQPAAGRSVSDPEPASIGLPPGFDAFYDHSWGRVLASARLLAENMADAEQAVVDAFAEAARRWDQVGGSESPEAYVRTIVRRLIVEEKKRWWQRQDPRWLRRVPLPPPPSDPELSAEVREVLAQVRRLTNVQRQVLVRHCLGFTSSEIAQELDMTPSAARTHLARARARLRSALGLWPEAGGKGTDGFAPAMTAGKGRPGEPGTGSVERDPLEELLAVSQQALWEAFAADEERKARIRAAIIARLAAPGRANARRSRR